MPRVARMCFCFGLLLLSHALAAYRIITPLPFGVANKNYIKLQVLAEPGDLPADSVLFDVLYNGGKKSIRLDASLSYTLRLNEFNDGVFFVQARVYHAGAATVLGSVYDPSGIPVILDRNPAFNAIALTAPYVEGSNEMARAREHTHEMAGNNNTVLVTAGWNSDSLYFFVDVKDANLNYSAPGRWNLFHAKNYLKALWTSDCIEIGLDLAHNRSEWKNVDDFELVVDVKGDAVGNQWSAMDSVYNIWGARSTIRVAYAGTINNNQDTDEGYTVRIAIPWSELNFAPEEGQAIGFDVQLYDKDADLDDAFRTSLSGTNPEANDNTSEWATLVLVPKPAAPMAYVAYLFPIALVAIPLYLFLRRRKKQSPAPVTPGDPVSYSKYTETALHYIAEHYHEPELSRHHIADKAFVTEKYLSSVFKKEVGVNLVSYINKLRIEKSVELLKDPHLTVSEVAFRVGYNSLQNFHKNFRAVTGKTPSDYRH